MPRKPRPIAERLNDLTLTPFDGSAQSCHIFLGKINENGYGYIRDGKRMRRAHRVAYEATHGPIPAGMHVCHVCDVTTCVNPKHLFLCTNQENALDREAKGRGRYGCGKRCQSALAA